MGLLVSCGVVLLPVWFRFAGFTGSGTLFCCFCSWLFCLVWICVATLLFCVVGIGFGVLDLVFCFGFRVFCGFGDIVVVSLVLGLFVSVC